MVWDHHHESGELSIRLEVDPRVTSIGSELPAWRIIWDDPGSDYGTYAGDLAIDYCELVWLCFILPQIRDSFESFLQSAGLATLPIPGMDTLPDIHKIAAWEGDHVIPWGDDRFLIRLETSPEMLGQKGVEPTWSLTKEGGLHEKFIFLDLPSVEAIGQLLIKIGSSYRYAQKQAALGSDAPLSA